MSDLVINYSSYVLWLVLSTVINNYNVVSRVKGGYQKNRNHSVIHSTFSMIIKNMDVIHLQLTPQPPWSLCAMDVL